MPFRDKRFSATALGLGTLLILGCGDDEVMNPPPVPTGTVTVSTASVGSAVDPDGYTILLDGTDIGPIGAIGSVSVGVAVGEYDVELTSLADNCAVIGENQGTVTVGEEATGIDFGVSCPPYYDYIAFSSTRGVGINIFVMESDGSNPMNLTPDTLLRGYPAWSPDATAIAFTAGSSNVYILNTADMSVRQVTTHGHVQLCDWSPDGTRIVYDRWLDCPNSHTCGDIYVINADGSNPVNLTPGSAIGGEPAWSPDGNRIAFVRRENRDDGTRPQDVWVMNADGSNPVQLTDLESSAPVPPRHSAVAFEPAWSPDGARIAFAGPGEQADHTVWVMNADGSNLTRLTEDLPDWQAWRPSWSPDGTWITYWVYRPDDGYCYQIYVMQADGSNPANITNHQSCNTGPAWSPGQ